MKPKNWKLCLIADVKVAGQREIPFIIKESIQYGVTLIQLRAKKLNTLEFFGLALELSEILKPKKVPFIINDRIDVALSCDADGVHLGPEDMQLEYARKILGNNKLIGITTNTVSEAIEAENAGADYIGVGPIYFTSSKKKLRPLLGIEGLKKIREKVKVPILAVGGIYASNARDIITAGADGVAVISSILRAHDVKKATIDLREALKVKT